MIPLRVSATNPSHEPAHFTVHKWPQDQVIVIVHQLVRVELNLVNLQPLVKNSFKGCKISLLLKYVRSQITPDSARGITRQLRQLVVPVACCNLLKSYSTLYKQQPSVSIKEPDPFDACDPFGAFSPCPHAIP